MTAPTAGRSTTPASAACSTRSRASRSTTRAMSSTRLGGRWASGSGNRPRRWNGSRRRPRAGADCCSRGSRSGGKQANTGNPGPAGRSLHREAAGRGGAAHRILAHGLSHPPAGNRLPRSQRRVARVDEECDPGGAATCGGRPAKPYPPPQHPPRLAGSGDREPAAEPLFPRITDLICQVQPGLPSLEQTLEAIELIATEVAPALGWRPCPLDRGRRGVTLRAGLSTVVGADLRVRPVPNRRIPRWERWFPSRYAGGAAGRTHRSALTKINAMEELNV